MSVSESVSKTRSSRRGAVLVEFAIVSFLLYLIVAAVLTFGRAIFVAQVLQQTSDTFSRELSRTPLPVGYALSDALADSTVRQTLFNEDDLEIDVTPWIQNDTGLTLDQYLQQQNVPLINRMLVPLMLVDDRSGGRTVLWYPGAVKDETGHFYVSVVDPNGGTAPTRVPVVEPVASPDPFPLAAAASGTTTAAPSGLAGVRFNFAFQAASLSATVPDGNSNAFVEANEPLDTGATYGGLYRGTDNLGQQLVGSKIVRPFQRLISAQAVYRREVFAPDPVASP